MDEIVNKRTDNPVIREYLYKTIPQTLNKNPIFVKVFGVNYAKKRFKSNVLAVYTNESEGPSRNAGYYNPSEKSITLCKAGKDGRLLTIEEIIANPNLFETALHECIHAILMKNKKECKKNKTLIETGLHIIYKSLRSGNEEEIGRGLNEGLTEWFCEKMGCKPQSYAELTNFVRLIELAIGTEKTMSLGYGDICYSMDIPFEEGMELMSNADTVYWANDDLSLYNHMIQALSKEDSDDIESLKEYREEQYKIYSEDIEKMKHNPEFIRWARENNKEITDFSLKVYITSILIPETRLKRDTSIVQFESLVLDKYFIKDLNRILNGETISDEDYEKCKKIMSVLNTPNLEEAAMEKYENMAAIKAVKSFKKLQSKYIKQAAKREAIMYNEGQLQLRDFIRRIKDYIGEDFYRVKQLLGRIL